MPGAAKQVQRHLADLMFSVSCQASEAFFVLPVYGGIHGPWFCSLPAEEVRITFWKTSVPWHSLPSSFHWPSQLSWCLFSLLVSIGQERNLLWLPMDRWCHRVVRAFFCDLRQNLCGSQVTGATLQLHVAQGSENPLGEKPTVFQPEPGIPEPPDLPGACPVHLDRGALTFWLLCDRSTGNQVRCYPECNWIWLNHWEIRDMNFSPYITETNLESKSYKHTERKIKIGWGMFPFCPQIWVLGTPTPRAITTCLCLFIILRSSG